MTICSVWRRYWTGRVRCRMPRMPTRGVGIVAEADARAVEDENLAASARVVYRHALEWALLPRLVWRLEAQLRGNLGRPDFLYEATRVSSCWAMRAARRFTGA